MRLLVIGGSDAGIGAGLRVRELDPGVEVTLLVADADPNFSICGLPDYRRVRWPTGGRSPTAPSATWQPPGSSCC